MHWQTLEITINRLQRNNMSEGELQRDSVRAKFAYTVTDGKVYNLGLPRWRADKNGQWIGDE